MTTKQQIAIIRKELKKRCKTLSVRNNRGTAWGWIGIRGSGDFGDFTARERATLETIGLCHGGNYAVISPDSRKYWLEKLTS